MFSQSKSLALLSLLIISAFVLGACQPQTIIKTVVVEKEGETIVQTVEVPVEAEAAGPIEATGLVACQPIPEIASTVATSAHLAKAVGVKPATAPIERFVGSPYEQGGAVYRVGVFEDVTTNNYWGANGPDNTVWNSYMLPSRLTLYSLSDKYFTFGTFAAKELPQPLVEEGDMWVGEIPLRDDIKWSDGTPFTAKDVAWTANTVLKLSLISGNWSTWYDAGFLDHVEAVDDYTAKFFFHTKPGVLRFEYGVLQAPILQEAFWTPKLEEAGVFASIDALAADASDEDKAAAQTEAHDKLFAIDPTGEPTAGGFTLTKWEKGAFLEQTAYADYFYKGTKITQWENGAYEDSTGLKTGTPEGDPSLVIDVGPNVESVVYTIYGSQDAAILAMKSGEVDFVINPLGLQRGLANQIITDPNLTVIENPVNGFRYLSFNVRRQPMNDCAFRQAVAVLIDKEFVTKTILQGVAQPYYTFVPPANEFWYNPDVIKLGEGLTREQRTNLAVAILEQAGYKWEGDQKPAWDADNRQVTQAGALLMADGTPVPPLKMLAPSPGYDPLRSTFAIWIETWLKEFGIPLTAELAGFNVIVPKIFTEHDFDMYILGWSLSTAPDHVYTFFNEEQAAPDGNNAGGYVNPEYEEKAKQMLTCESFEDCKAIAFETQEILATELPYVLLFDTGIIEAYRSASVEYPYTEVLSGLQYIHQGPGNAMQTYVKVK